MQFINFLNKNEVPETPLTQVQVEDLLEGISVPKDRILFNLVLNTGMDYKELLQLRWDDISFRGEYIHVYDKQLKRLRTVYAPKGIFEELERYRGQNDGAGLVFDSTDYLLQQKRKEWTTRCLGFEVSWHKLRLTYITLAASKGIPLEIASENSGVSPTMLFKYWKRDGDYIKNIINKH